MHTMISAQIRKSFTYLFQKREPLIVHHFFSTSTKEEGNLKVSTNSESVALFLKELGISDSQLEKVFQQCTRLHSANLEKTIKPKIKVFHDFGFSNPEIAELVAREPTILCISAHNRLLPTLSYLNDLLRSSHDDLFKVAKRMAWFFNYDMKRHFLPNIELLNGYGVPIERIVFLVKLNPEALHVPHENLRRCIDKLETLGMHPGSKMYIYAVWYFGGLRKEVLDQKMQVLRDSGFTESEILDMLKKLPLILSRSAKTLKDITEMLLATKKYSKASIVTHPRAFSCSIEKRLKPRLVVLELLEKMNLLKKWPSLGVVSGYGVKRFHDSFLAPYRNQLEEAYAANKESLITATAAA